MNAPQFSDGFSVSRTGQLVERPFASNFQRAIYDMTQRRPHLNAASGSQSLREKKRLGIKAHRYDDVVELLKAARRDGTRRGCGAEAVALLLNEIVRDSLPAEEPLDVIARPVDGDLEALKSRRDEELCFAINASELITTIEVVTADGVIDVHESRMLEGSATKVTRGVRRLIAATRGEVR
jgi:hypothetical protein